jgi:radical SAM protein with 4Fe4S-binding SPASM domain
MIGTRYISENRKPLQELLPMKQPLVLFVDPSDRCCLKCSFCPTSDIFLMQKVNRPLNNMSFDLFKKIVNDLYEFENPIKVLRLYGMGEPLLNKDFCSMVKYAKTCPVIESIDTTSNGICLNPTLNLKLVESGLDRINISINGLNNDQYRSFTKTNIDFNRLVGNITHLYENKKQLYIFIKINGDTITEEDEQKFLEIFGPIADSVAIERSLSCWNGFSPEGFIRSDSTKGIYGQELKEEALVCPYSMYNLFVHSDGKVARCFLDWNRKLVFEDVNKKSVRDIWQGKSQRNFQSFMLEGKRKQHSICKDCDQLIGGLPSNIDNYAKQIITDRNENKYK